MAEEINALQKQRTWSLVPIPTNKWILGCKWTYKTKLLPIGQIDRHKARLVALGYDQTFGENYTETFSLITKMPTIRTLTLTISRKWQMLQLDVSNTFLHDDLLDDIYMRQPSDFEDPHQPNYVCNYINLSTVLSRRPRQWFQKFTSFLQSLDFEFSHSNPSLLIFSKHHIYIYLLIYVDDILVTGNDSSSVQTHLQVLHS